ncbi:MAG: solute-binding protein [Proteobacteria bacterium]|nr:solute-binding protein [Pseudomonadota bacterium]NIS71240.1 solute-binding protein [Pseudomonadota bacterium]
MRKSVFFILAILCLGFTTSVDALEQRLRVASTTSTDNTGLFSALNPPFERIFHCPVDVIAQGTGKALKTGQMGDCDIVFVHSRPAEDEFVEAGHGVNRRDVMYNDFVILGPKSDPAQVRGTRDAAKAFRKIAAQKSLFISRGDDSGTHKKEIAVWRKGGTIPTARWYLEAGQGMGAILQMANERQAYTLSDRGTYLAYKEKIDLEVLAEGDPLLFNPYGIIAVNPAKHPAVNYVLAMAYIGWVTSPEGQKIISEFGKRRFGQPLFIPMAIP